MSPAVLNRIRLVLRLALAAAIAYVLCVVGLRLFSYRKFVAAKQQEEALGNDPIARIYLGDDVKITQFYSPDGKLLCYGVVNAKSVRIEPHIDGVSPSISRCVEAAPKKTTRYILAAEGHDGSTVRESLEIKVR